MPCTSCRRVHLRHRRAEQPVGEGDSPGLNVFLWIQDASALSSGDPSL
jgi:hypothetical protein